MPPLLWNRSCSPSLLTMKSSMPVQDPVVLSVPPRHSMGITATRFSSGIRLNPKRGHEEVVHRRAPPTTRTASSTHGGANQSAAPYPRAGHPLPDGARPHPGGHFAEVVPHVPQVVGEVAGRRVAVLGALGQAALHDPPRGCREAWGSTPAAASARSRGWPRGSGPRSGARRPAARWPSRTRSRPGRTGRTARWPAVRPPARATCSRRCPRMTPRAVAGPTRVSSPSESLLRRGWKSRSTRSFASPKSRTLANPSRVTMTFSGLRSRWTMPAPWALARPSAICAARSMARFGSSAAAGRSCRAA